MNDATGLAGALLGLNSQRMLAVEETASEVIMTVETGWTSSAARERLAS